jgi:hypothetical protein
MVMAERAKHAFGSLENIDSAIANGTIDSYDILFVKDADGKPYVGWVDKQGNKVVVSNDEELAELESQIATKVSAEEVDAKINTTVTDKVNTIVTEKVDAAVTEEVKEVMAEKVDTVINEKVDTVVNEKVETLVTEKVTEQVTEKVETTVVKAMAKTNKYEILNVPKGTLVDYSDKEIRIFCPETTVWEKQTVGATGDPNCYYATLRTYISNDDAVGYIEHLGAQVDKEILTDIKTDGDGRRYQDSWIALARYDGAADTWTYYGATSTNEKYIGWDYQLDLFDADGAMIGVDSVRIGLANEGCYFVNVPYYVGAMEKKIEDKIAEIETKIEESESSYEIIEF